MTPHAKLAATIDSAFEDRAKFTPGNAPAGVIAAVDAAIDLLDRGTARVAEKIDGQWRVHEWLKKAVLLSFRLNDNRPVDAGYTNFYDKVPLKYADYDADRFRADGVRVVPPAVVRRGAYVASNAVLIANHGVVSCGRSLDEALFTCIVVERIAQMRLPTSASASVPITYVQ